MLHYFRHNNLPQCLNNKTSLLRMTMSTPSLQPDMLSLLPDMLSLQPDMLSLLPDMLSLLPHTLLPVPCPHLISLSNLSSLFSLSLYSPSLPSHEHSLAKTSSSLPSYRLLSPNLINSHKSFHTYQTMTTVPLAGGPPPRMWDMQLPSLCPPPPCPSPTLLVIT